MDCKFRVNFPQNKEDGLVSGRASFAEDSLHRQTLRLLLSLTAETRECSLYLGYLSRVKDASSDGLGTFKPSVRCRLSNVFAANISGMESDGEYHSNPGVMSGAK